MGGRRGGTDTGVTELIKGEKYRVRVEAGRDPRTGQRKQLSRTVYGNHKEACRVRDEMLAMVGDSSWLRSGMTVSELWERMYRPDIGRRLRPDTVDGYERNYRRYVEEPLGRMMLRDLTPISLKMWLEGIETEGARFVAYSFLRTMLNKAVRWDLMRDNPCMRIEPPRKPDDHEPEVLTAEEAAAYIEAFRGAKSEAAVLVAIGCGLRRSEIVALDWGDLRGGWVRVDSAVNTVNGRAYESDTKSRFSRRSVAVPKGVWKRLMELRHAPDTPLLPDSRGGRLHPDNLTSLYAKERDALVPEWCRRVPLRDLRHTSLTLALQGGADLLAVSRRAGHSNVAVTSRYYIRPDKSVDEAAASGMDALLGG